MVDIQQLTHQVYENYKNRFQQSYEAYLIEAKNHFESKKDRLDEYYHKEKEKQYRSQMNADEARRGELVAKKQQKKLAIKQTMIGDYKKALYQQLMALPADVILEWLNQELEHCENPQEIEVIMPAHTLQVLENSLDQIPFEVRKLPASTDGGFIIKQGHLQYNYLFKQLIENSREKINRLVIAELEKEE